MSAESAESYPLPDRFAPRFREAMKTLMALRNEGDLDVIHLLNPLRVQRPSPVGFVEDEVMVLDKGQRLTISGLGIVDGMPYMQVTNSLGNEYSVSEWCDLGNQLYVDSAGMSLGRLLAGEFQVRYGGHWNERARLQAKTEPLSPTYKEEALEPAEEVLAWLEQQQGEF